MDFGRVIAWRDGGPRVRVPGGVLAHTELPASRMDSELLRGGLVHKRRPYDPLNVEFNDYNPYRTSGEFKPRKESGLIVEDRARPDEAQLLMSSGETRTKNKDRHCFEAMLLILRRSLRRLGGTVEEKSAELVRFRRIVDCKIPEQRSGER